MKKILYVFDDINYESGARNATIYQIRCLSQEFSVKVLSLSKPNPGIIEKELILDLGTIWDNVELFVKGFATVIKSGYPIRKKLLRAIYAVALRTGNGEVFLNRIINQRIIPILESFDVVIVVSEASKLRKVVSNLKCPKKIQWIHTDYKLWSEFSDWTRAITKHDKDIYEKFDHIVALTEINKKGLLEKLPSLAGKVSVIPNLVDFQRIQRLSQEEIPEIVPKRKCKFITVGRIDREKNFEGILDVCRRLKKDGLEYSWVIVGDGPLFQEVQKKVSEYGLEDYVFMIGRQQNPYPWMRSADYLVLLSRYEGTPVTIDEATALGISVIATAVGGIPEQVKHYQNGFVISDNNEVYSTIKCVATQNIYIVNHADVGSVNEITIKSLLELLNR